MSKPFAEWYTIEVVHHSRINNPNRISQVVHGPIQRESVVYRQQLPKTDISGLVALAETLSNQSKPSQAEAPDVQE